MSLLILGAFASFTAYSIWVHFRPARSDLKAAFANLEEQHRLGDFEQAYLLATPGYREQKTLGEFRKEFPQWMIISSPAYSPDKNDENLGTVHPCAWTGGAILGFEKVDGQWLCSGLKGWSMD